MGFVDLYCTIWKVIKAWVQAFNIFLGLFPVFGHSLVTVFQLSYIKQYYVNQVGFITNIENCIK